MTAFDRPDDLDPAPREAVEWLDARNDQAVTMLEAQLASLIEESDRTLYLDLLADDLTFAVEGPDPQGVFNVEIVRKAGEAASRAEVHWRGAAARMTVPDMRRGCLAICLDR